MNKGTHVYELIIIGAGPAGITSAIYAARKKMDFLVTATNIGGQVVYSSEIENYTGFQYISGEELTEKFQQHLEHFMFELRNEEARKIEKNGDLFNVTTDMGMYTSKTVIVATGRRPRELNVPGENEFKNRGVTYCATCDAPFFQDMDVAVVGGGNSGLDAVLQLTKIARRIVLLEATSQLKADSAYVEKARAYDKVQVWTNSKVTDILGDKTVTGLKVQRAGKEELIPVQGIFIEIGSVPNSDVVDFVGKNQWGEIVVNCRCETSAPGLFAAGDVTDVPEKQIVVAAGEGCKAALSAYRYLSRK